MGDEGLPRLTLREEASLAAQPFVGRARPLRELEAAAAQAARGQGALVLVAGEPGIGKTRLVEELASRLAGRDAGVLWAACWEGPGAPAFWPWLQLVRSYAAAREPNLLRVEVGPGGGVIARLVPEIAERLPDLPALAETGPEEGRFQLYDGLGAFLRRAGQARPLLLVLDDLHWADEPSLQVLRFLAADLHQSRLLVVGTYRDVEIDDRHPLMQLVGQLSSSVHSIHLGGLRQHEVGALVAQLADGPPPDERLVRAVHERTGGNPLFVREVLRLLDSTHDGGAAVPDSVREVVQRRLRRLSAPCRELLAAASVVGAEFTVAWLSPALRQPARELRAAIDEAVEARLLETAGDVRYRFSHALVREVLYSSLPPHRRRDLHHQVAAVIELHHEGREAELARHYHEAGEEADLTRALDYAERAALRSYRLHAHEDAVGHLRRALALLELVDPDNPWRRCELLLELGEALKATGETRVARGSYEQAGVLARQIGAPDLLARAALGLGTDLAAGSGDEVEIGLLEEALRALGAGDPLLRARLLARLAGAVLFSAGADRAPDLADEAAGIARELGDPATLAEVLYARHQALWAIDPPEDRLRMTGEIMDLAESVGDSGLALGARALRIADLLELGMLGQLRSELDTYERLVGDLRQLTRAWHGPLQRAHLAALAGAFEEAELLGAEVLALGRRVEHRGIDVFHSTVIITLGYLRGRFAELEPALRQAVRAIPSLHSYRAGLALALCEAGRHEEARAELQRLAGGDFHDIPRNVIRVQTLCVLALVCQHLGDRKRAALLREQLLPNATYNVLLSRLGGTMGSTRHYLGVLALTMERWDEAVSHLEAAVESHARQGFGPLLANSRLLLARALLARQRPEDGSRARGELDLARAAADALGIRLVLSERIAQAVQRADASLRREGELWTLTHGGRDSRMRDTVGMGVLVRLLAEPGREFHALDLGSARGRAATPSQDAGPVLDERARAQYRERLREIGEEMEEAEAWGDPERLARARLEADLLTEQLAAAVGLGGRDRRAASDAERARVNVTKALRAAVQRIAAQDAELGAHLHVSLRTGTYCAYVPDPASPIRWIV
jgi:tetratricopeptide (TPR) repeat protein